MAMIDDGHVEWRVVARLHELLERLPKTEHDVTLTYALFTSTICWTCQRLRETKSSGRHQDIWSEIDSEKASDSRWRIDQLRPQLIEPGSLPLDDLPASWFLIGLRNGVAHGDHRNVVPHHMAEHGADRELRGFEVTTHFREKGRDWGCWSLRLTRPEMRRIGLLISRRFVDTLSQDGQSDALRHVIGA